MALDVANFSTLTHLSLSLSVSLPGKCSSLSVVEKLRGRAPSTSWPRHTFLPQAGHFLGQHHGPPLLQTPGRIASFASRAAMGCMANGTLHQDVLIQEHQKFSVQRQRSVLGKGSAQAKDVVPKRVRPKLGMGVMGT